MGSRDHGTVVLDSGAVIGLARGNRDLIARLEGLRHLGLRVRVPMVVVAETTRGFGPRDARTNLVLAHTAPHDPLDEPTARLAGRLLAAAGGNNTVDALVAAEAIRHAPAVLLTSDPSDLVPLLAGHSQVRVVAI